MYNGKYGKIRYGLKDGVTKIVKVQGNLCENICNISGHGETILVTGYCHERITTSIKAHNVLLLEDTGSEDVSGNANMGTCYSRKAQGREARECECNAKKIIYLVNDLHEEINSDCYASKNIWLNLKASDSIEGHLFIGKIIPLGILMAEQVNADISANVLEKEIARIDVTIPPGGELRIDSSVFNATLNGENILHLYNGDWIMISRDTTTLTVQTASGGKVVGQLLYTERYL